MVTLNNTYRRYSYNLPVINYYAENEAKGFIDTVEEQFHSDLDNIAESIMELEKQCNIIMLTGPSSSGKLQQPSYLNQSLKVLEEIPI